MENRIPTTAIDAARQRKREARIGNERAKASAGIAITIANFIIIAALIAPVFSEDVRQTPPGIAFALLIAGLLYGAAQLILGTLEPED